MGQKLQILKYLSTYDNEVSDAFLDTKAANYPNQSIRARFYKTGIKGGVNIDGKFYYNGL